MRPNPQAPAHPSHTGGTDPSVITRALETQSFSRAQPHVFDARIMAPRTKAIKSFIANHSFLQYRTRTEFHFFCAQSLAPETIHLPLYGSMNTMWRSQ
jgi:hypothetical protein